jgi:hypothetical protein
VLGPGRTTPAHLVALVAQTTCDLLRVLAQRAVETQKAEQRLHTAVLRLLLRGQHHLATNVLGTKGIITHATVYRLTGPDLSTAHHDLWRVVQNVAPLSDAHMLVCLEETELVVVALHSPLCDLRSIPSLIARFAERHQITGGASEPAPLHMFATAWAEARSTLQHTAAGSLTSAAGLGAHGLLRTIPEHLLTTWAADVLHPLDHDQRRTLEAYLRLGSAQGAAPALCISEGTVRNRLRVISTTIEASLDQPTVQAQLLLALRAPALPTPCSPGPPAPIPADSPVPTQLLSPDQARCWASGLLEPLGKQMLIALRCWLQHCGRTAPAARELGVHRNTLSAWLVRCSQDLGLDLSSGSIRSELHLAVETIATPDDIPSRLPRRGGRTYRALTR